MATALTIDGPVAIRYPRGNGYGVELDTPQVLPVGQCEVLGEGADGLVIAVGTRAHDALQAVEKLSSEDGLTLSLINLRFIKPLDEQEILAHLKQGKLLAVVEEGVATGGVGEGILSMAVQSGWSGRFVHVAMPDTFPEHGTQAEILGDLGLDSSGIFKQLRTAK